jgi:hypothetical protein
VIDGLGVNTRRRRERRNGPFSFVKIKPGKHRGCCCGGCGEAEPLQDIATLHSLCPLDEFVYEPLVVGLVGDQVRPRRRDERVHPADDVGGLDAQGALGDGDRRADRFTAGGVHRVVGREVVAVEEIGGAALVDPGQPVEVFDRRWSATRRWPRLPVGDLLVGQRPVRGPQQIPLLGNLLLRHADSVTECHTRVDVEACAHHGGDPHDWRSALGQLGA